ncbi:MAG: hypothetical protein M0024_03795 [Nitrospiraceae bacterium]|nr:hypothetical protein [Nitrospiraceae bacterium]
MKEERKQTMRAGTKIGAVLGFIAFLAVGLMPTIYFASFGSLMLMSRLAGGPVEPTTIIRMLTVVGIMLGIFCAGAVGIVLGSVFGTALAYIVDVVGSLGKAKETEEVKAHN